jgi:large subunit ribosomal protein L28
MARCAVTGKKAMTGYHVSHARNHVKRFFKVNIQKKRYYSETLKRWLTIMVSAKGMKMIDKNGFDHYLPQVTERD